MKLHIDESKANTKLPTVMRAALRLFIMKGIHGTTIKDIAGAAGVAEGALYRHYKGKDDLAWDLFHTHLTQFTHELEEAMRPHRTIREKLHAFIRESFFGYESDPELFSFLILREHSELSKYAQDRIHPGTLIVSLMKKGQARGDIRKGDPFVLGSIVIGTIIRLATVRMYGTMTNDLRTQVEPVSESLWQAVQFNDEKGTR